MPVLNYILGFDLAGYQQNAQTGTSYTLADSVAGMLTTLNNASAIAVSVPGTLTPGKVFSIVMLGAGQATFTGTGGLTVQPPPGFAAKSRGQYARLQLEVISSTLAVLSGDCAPV